jgi:hypothetical protein
MQVYANCITPVQSLRQNAVANGKRAAATPCSSIAESSCKMNKRRNKGSLDAKITTSKVTQNFEAMQYC